MSQFIQRFFTYLANEVITKRLANSHTFITVAHAFHVNLQKAQKVGVEAATVAGAELQKKQQQMLKAAQEQAKQQAKKKF